MAELNQKVLFTACRAIYDLAGANYVLPPLLRGAESPETQPSYCYNCLVWKNELCFSVALDETYADRNALVHSRLPLKFHVELREAQFPNAAVELSEAEEYALIRAFFLGVKLPIAATKTDEESPYKLSVQLSSTFFVDCGELDDECRDCLPKVICDDVGRKIYARSNEFFAVRQQGIDVWSLRAAQGLFGEAKPPAEALWPDVPEAADVVVCPAPANGNERAVPRRPRYALAATILIGLLAIGALATGFRWRSVALAPSETAANPTPIELAAEQPEPAFLPPRGTTAHDIDAAQQADATSPAIAAPSAPAANEAQPARRDCTICDEDPATLAAASPVPALRAEAKPKQAPDAKAESGNRHQPLRRFAMSRQSLPAKALAFTRGAVASLNGFAKVIGRIPGEIIKPARRLKI